MSVNFRNMRRLNRVVDGRERPATPVERVLAGEELHDVDNCKCVECKASRYYARLAERGQ